jgi:L-lactate utilization protein LutC
MNFLKRLFNIPIQDEDSEIEKQEVNLSLDDLFVHNFVKKGGKFLYCLNTDEVIENLKKVLLENDWDEVYLLDEKLASLFDINKVRRIYKFNDNTPILSSCEHLIADNGDILFSSNQLRSTKLREFSENFIVYASTSQLVKDTGQGLTGIKTNNIASLPTNISALKNYIINNNDDNFLNYGNSNSKNLYLLLLEDL